jgi:LAGLIDADG endonuclease
MKLIEKNDFYSKEISLFKRAPPSKKKTNEFMIDHPVYFPAWLSGFIEAEGSFCLREKNHPSFSIGHKEDDDLLKTIRTYFHSVSTSRLIITKKNPFYLWEVYRREVLNNICEHCTNYPLIGEKRDIIAQFKEGLKLNSYLSQKIDSETKRASSKKYRDYKIP